MAHIQKKIYMAISDEEYLKKMQDIVYTEQAKEIFNVNVKIKVQKNVKIKIHKILYF